MCYSKEAFSFRNGITTEPELNFKPALLTAISDALGLPQVAPFGLPEDATPEEILAYIYAVLYSPTFANGIMSF